MNIKIQLHIMPWEIDHALLIADKLKQSIQYINPSDKIYIDSALNLSSSVINWNDSKLPKEYFIKRYESICKYFNTGFIHKPFIYDNDQIYGHLDLQRSSVEPDIDAYLYICADVGFSKYALYYMIESAKAITNKYYVITPQIYKCWDNSFDGLVHKPFLNVENEQCLSTNYHELEYKTEGLTPALHPLPYFKYCGWFDLYSKSYVEDFAPILPEWSGYGPWDLYSTTLANNFKDKYDVQQYVLQNQLIWFYDTGDLANPTYGWDGALKTVYDDLIIKKLDRKSQRANIESNLNQLVQNWVDTFKEKSKPIGISLGWNCGPAGYGVENGIRETKANGYRTCPFDEMVSNLPGVVECIRDDFKYFLDDEFLEVKPVPFTVGGTKKGEYLIYNTKYNFFFNHESPGHANLYIEQNWAGGINHYVDNNFRLFKERYNRRVQAFKDYIQQGLDGTEIKFIVFRYNHDVKMLDNMLKEKYPTLKYRIIVVSPFAPLETVDFVYKQHLLMGMKEENAQIEVKHEL